MSQAGILSVSATPSVPTTFTADSGSATPALNNINILANDSTSNNANGISTTGSGSTITVVLSNRFVGTVTTTNATPDSSILLSLGATPGVYTFDVQIAAYDTTDLQGLGYAIFGTVRTTGAAAVLVGTPDKIVNEENTPVNLAACDANLTVNANTAVITITGIAAKTINWRVLATFVFVS